MDMRDIAAFSRLATRETQVALQCAARRAHDHWLFVAGDEIERADLAGVRPRFPIPPGVVADRAANAAIELGIVVWCWPDTVDAVLRRPGRPYLG